MTQRGPLPQVVSTAFATHRIESQSLLDARMLIVAGRGQELLDGIILMVRHEASDEAEVLERTMSILESAMDHDLAVAGYLMAKMAPLASAAYLHDIRDGIALWLDNKFHDDLAATGRTPYSDAPHYEWFLRRLEDRCRSALNTAAV